MLLLPLITLCVRSMDQVNFDCSLKSIPIPSAKEYLSELIHSTAKFAANLSWKVYWFLNPLDFERKETYNFKTTEPAPNVIELKDFYDDLFDLVKNVKFRRTPESSFQSTLRRNMNRMNNDNSIYVAADKTNNYYRMSEEEYDELHLKNITNEYKKCNEAYIDRINQSDRILAEDLGIENRVYAYSTCESFVTIKDHKENYINNTKCRLISPAKSNMGKVSKIILSRIVSSLREKTSLIQWVNSSSTIQNGSKILLEKRLLLIFSLTSLNFIRRSLKIF